MEINKERKLFQDFLIENFDFEHHEQTYFDEKTQCYENDHGEDTEVVNVAWEVWKAAKSQATPEGFDLMPIKPTETMVMAVAKEHEGDAFLPYSLYDAFVKQAMIEAREQK
ncbi:hypothetical protein ACG93R_05420 [Acinetobacter guillouiae]|uniref:hypothetical protein n=1 Tax=Acinetobacter guillouiae TaxID=106649 RepID=UPI003AF8584C